MQTLLVQCLLLSFLPIVSSEYTIQNCGGSRSDIDNALEVAQTLMFLSRVDVQRGVDSTFGYTAMYKSNSFKVFLHKLMNNILNEANTKVAGREEEPSFVCVTPNMEHKYDIGYDHLRHCTDTGVTSFWAKSFVFLCPNFLDDDVYPDFGPSGPYNIYCPAVQNNVFLGQSDPLIKYQSYDLMHQLVGVYLQRSALTSQTVPKAVADWNGCVGLGGESIRNPANFVYYVACKCHLDGMRSYQSANWRQSSLRDARRCQTRSSHLSRGQMIKRGCFPKGT